MIDTSKDILFLVLSICVAFFTIFLCLLLYYTIKILKRVNKAVEEVKNKFDRLHSTLESGLNYFGIISEVAKMAFAHFVGNKKSKRKK